MRPLNRKDKITSAITAWKPSNDNAPDGGRGEKNVVVWTSKVALLGWGTNVWDIAENPLLDTNLQDSRKERRYQLH
jgi:hypothetical protein